MIKHQNFGELRNSGEKFCFFLSPSQYDVNQGYFACIVIKNVNGYYVSEKSLGFNFCEAEKQVEIENEKLGCDQDDVNKIIMSTMVGKEK